MPQEKTKGPFVFISGANQGIGLQLVHAILRREPSAVIFAGARTPATAHDLRTLSLSNSNVKVVQLTVDDEASNKLALEKVKQFTNHLDIVIANAGISTPAAPLHSIGTAVYRDLLNVNTFGPLFLYKAAYPLLFETRVTDTSLPPPRFLITSTGLASMGDFCKDLIVAPYGMSKAAANYLAVTMHHETVHVNGVVVAYHPGLVKTDMNKVRHRHTSMADAISPAQSGTEYASLILTCNRDEHGGKFFWRGSDQPKPW